MLRSARSRASERPRTFPVRHSRTDRLFAYVQIVGPFPFAGAALPQLLERPRRWINSPHCWSSLAAMLGQPRRNAGAASPQCWSSFAAVLEQPCRIRWSSPPCFACPARVACAGYAGSGPTALPPGAGPDRSQEQDRSRTRTRRSRSRSRSRRSRSAVWSWSATLSRHLQAPSPVRGTCYYTWGWAQLSFW